MVKLMLVDDEPLILNGIIKMLRWDALQISVSAACSNALSSLEIMRDDMPDILMADVKMPGMSGLELVEQARMLNPALRCIMLSAYDDFDYARRAMRAGAIEYLLKPCSQEEIEGVLIRARDAVQAEQNLRQESIAQRRERIMTLAEQLGKLLPERNGSITDTQVREVCAAVQGESLLQEAMTYLVTHSVQGLAQAEWSLRTVKNLYASEQEIYASSAHALSQLRTAQESKRGFVQQMQDFVMTHYSMESLSLQYLSEHLVYMSADYIGKEFTHATGMKFSAYLLSVRMEQAKLLLTSQPDLHTYEIAERVGLGHNPRYFSQLFRKYTGMTPSEFGKEMDKSSDF